MKIMIFDIESYSLAGKDFSNLELVRVREISWFLYEGKLFRERQNFQLKFKAKKGYKTGESFFYAYLGNVLKEVDMLVSHNIGNDLKVLEMNFKRVGVPFSFSGKRVCTMLSSTGFCKLPSRYGNGYKYPSLRELYKKLFNAPLIGQHTSKGDCEALVRCFWKLVEKRQISIFYYSSRSSH